MKRTNKVRLTESQLHRVIKESVRKVLKENNNNGTYRAIDISYRSVENSYENGETMDTEQYWSSQNMPFKGNSIKELVSTIADHYDCDLEDVYIYNDFVMMGCMTDENNMRLDDNEMNSWRNGEMKGYYFEIKFRVVKQSPLSHDELVSSGFNSYD